MKRMALLTLVMLLLLGVGGACAEEMTTATIDLVFDGKTYTDTVQVEWTEKYPVPEGGVKWDGTREFIQYTPHKEEQVCFTPDGLSYVDGQIMFSTPLGDHFDEVEQIAAKYNAIIVAYIALTENYIIEPVQDHSLEHLNEIMSRLEKEEIIEKDSVMLNYLYPITGLEDELLEKDDPQYAAHPLDPWSSDPETPAVWKAKLDRLNTTWRAVAIRAPEAWRYQDKMQLVKVGVVDTFSEIAHKDIVYSPINDKTIDGIISHDNNDSDELEHGTFIAGIVSAIHGNGKGISGIAPNSAVYPYGLQISSGRSLYELIAGVSSCINHGIRVINLSQGLKEPVNLGTILANMERHFLSRFFGKLDEMEKDYLLMLCAGNADYDAQKLQPMLELKEFSPHFVVVSSVIPYSDGKNGLAFNKGHAWGKSVDLLAPGGFVFSTICGEDGNGYTQKLGTSFAAPHVAAVAAMIWGLNPDLPYTEVKRILISNYRWAYSDGHNNTIPLVDAYACVQDVLGVGTVTGRVVIDTVNGLQTEVEVTQNGEHVATLETDENGYFSADLPIGQYNLSVKKDGYLPIDKNIEVSPGNDVVEVFSLKIEIVPPEMKKGTLNGRVTFDSQELNNVEVNVLKGTTHVATLITNAGNFSVDLEPGTYTLSIDADGYIPVSRSITVFTGKTTTENIELDDSMYAVATQTMNASIQYDVKLFNAHDSITQLDMKVTLRNGTVLMDTANGIRSGITMKADGFAFQIDDELAQGAQLEVTAADGQGRTYSGAIVLSSGLWSGAKKLPDNRSNGGYWDANGFYHESDY